MKAATSGGRPRLTLFTALSLVSLGALALVSPNVLAGTPKQDYSLSAPAQTVTQPAAGNTAEADFTVTMVPGPGGYSDPVQLSVKDLPKGVTADWSSGTAVTTDDPSRVLMITVPATLKVGTYTFKVHGENADTGKDGHDVDVTLGVAAPTAVSPAPGFSLTVAPSAATVTQGDTATYTVTLFSTDPPTGGVTLSANGLPHETSATFSPTSLDTSGTSSTLTVETTDKAHTGDYHFKVTGLSGKAKYEVVVALSVVAAPKVPGFTLAISPDGQQIAAGGIATYAIGIGRTDFAALVTLSVDGLPVGATAAFDPNPADDSTTLTVTTDAVTTPDGDYTLVISGSGGGDPVTTASVKTKLKVKTPPGKAFGISGDATGTLYPGGEAAPIDLLLSNPNDKPILVTNLVVTVVGTNHEGCTSADFEVTPYSGGYPLRLEKKTSRPLSGLGIPEDFWPTLSMLNRSGPNGLQDACKDATVQLSYSGNAQEAK